MLSVREVIRSERMAMTVSADSTAGGRPAAATGGPARATTAAGSGNAPTVAGGLPDYTGRDARDAAMDVLARGFVPYVLGAGVVVRQFPAAGATAADACTLYCAVGG